MLPTFLIIGTGRAGTTSLYNYLGAHPEIYMSPVKETRFFAFDFETQTPPGPGHEEPYRLAIKTMAEYQALFDGVSGEKAIGEVSPHYLDYTDSAARIARYIPDVQIIATVRHPAERAYSGYMKQRMEGREPCKSFEDALAEQEDRERAGSRWGIYLEKAFLGKLLKVYYDTFPAERIKVILFEDLVTNTQDSLRDLYQFLNVDPDFRGETFTQHNRSVSIKNQRLFSAMNKAGPLNSAARMIVPKQARQTLRAGLKRMSRGDKQPLTNQTRRRLTDYFSDDIALLSQTIGRDLSHWMA